MLCEKKWLQKHEDEEFNFTFDWKRYKSLRWKR